MMPFSYDERIDTEYNKHLVCCYKIAEKCKGVNNHN